MGFFQASSNNYEIFDNLEAILNKSILSIINKNLEKNIEYKNNYNFICSLVDYYQSLKNNLNINKKYSYYIISSKTKNISSFNNLKKTKQIFLNWIKLLYKTQNEGQYYILDNKELEINQIKSKIIHNIKQNKLLNIFKENFNNYYNSINNRSFIKLILSGLPQFLRPIIWKIILEKKTKLKERPSLQQCLNLECNPKILKQIFKDINRTFVINNEDNFSTIEKSEDDKINKLKNILIAISNYNPDLGYTQGMNNIIGFILKITNFDEEKAFDLAILILEKIKGYYFKDFPLLKENLNKFNIDFNKRYNKLYKHCKKNEIPDELWISKWIQTLFTINFPFNEVCRIWDALIVFGFDFIIYISLAIVYFAEDELIKLDDSSDFLNYLNELMNPVPGVKKYYNEFSNYKDFVIPIYNIISKAKKIKREIIFDTCYFNKFKNKFYNDEIKENNNYFNHFHLNNSSNTELMSNSSIDLAKQNENRKIFSLKSYSSENIIYKSYNILSSLNQPKIEKKENNNCDNFHFDEKRRISDISNFSVDLLRQDNALRKNSDISDYSFNQQENNIKVRNISEINDYNIYSPNQNMALGKKNNFNNYLIKNNNNDINKIFLNNNFKNGNYYYSGFNNVNLIKNKSNNFVNGRPRRNMKILIHKKVYPLFNPPSNAQSSKNKRDYISKSPNFIRIGSKYNLNNISYNLDYTYAQNQIFDKNKFFVNLQRRESYYNSLPVKYCYYRLQNNSKIFI